MQDKKRKMRAYFLKFFEMYYPYALPHIEACTFPHPQGGRILANSSQTLGKRPESSHVLN